MKIFNNPLIRVVAAFLFVAVLSLSIHTVRSSVSSAPDFPTASIGANSPVVVVEIPPVLVDQRWGKYFMKTK